MHVSTRARAGGLGQRAPGFAGHGPACRRPWQVAGGGGAAPKVSPPATARRDGRCRGVVGGGDAGGRCRIPIRCGSGLAATLASSR